VKIMRITSSTLPVWCAATLTSKPAHPQTVGLLAVQEPRVLSGVSRQYIGGLPVSGTSRITNEDQRLAGVYGTGVRADKGSQKPATFAPANDKASGVPPRGRPV
jgi:hypothetical protein